MTTPFDAPDWRDMDQAARDAGLNNAGAVKEAAAIVAGWEQRSAAMRAAYPDHLDLRYGPRARNRFDLFKAAEGAPTLLFIHGGYWQTRAKESFAHLAAGPIAHGLNVALTGYTLAPEAMLDDIVAEIHAAIDALVAQAPALGCDVSRLVVVGWSAGGHLTTMALAHPQVKAGVAISGIYDLEPIRHSYLNDKLRLDEAMSRRNSPMLQSDGATKPLALVCGDAELPLLRRQSAAYAAHRAMQGLPLSYEEIPGADHFTILDEMERPDGRVTRLIVELMERI